MSLEKKMKVKIKRLNKSLPMPFYATNGSVGFDLYARLDITIEPGEIKVIPANVIIEIPDGYALKLYGRSSTPKKYGLFLANAVGIIDQDYCGPKDELGINVYNFRDAPVTVKRGERIAQGVFTKIEKVEWKETDSITNKTRGGFGSTD
ncbi:MAG: dUTP diphosphatase [Nanoarchaeota archaeon]